MKLLCKVLAISLHRPSHFPYEQNQYNPHSSRLQVAHISIRLTFSDTKNHA